MNRKLNDAEGIFRYRWVPQLRAIYMNQRLQIPLFLNLSATIDEEIKRQIMGDHASNPYKQLLNLLHNNDNTVNKTISEVIISDIQQFHQRLHRRMTFPQPIVINHDLEETIKYIRFIFCWISGMVEHDHEKEICPFQIDIQRCVTIPDRA